MATTYTQSLESSGLVATSSVLVQTKTAVFENGKPGFRVSNLLNDPGQLPDRGAFLVRITDSSDPTGDTLARVASIADFFTFPSIRSEAVRAGLAYYRSTSWSVFYEDLTLAIAGAKQFKDLVNKLTQDWMTYVYQFQYGPPGDFVELPSTDLSALQALINAWERAKLASANTEATLNLATAKQTAAQDALTAAQDKYTLVSDAHAILDDLTTQSDMLKQLIDNLSAASAYYGSEPVPFPRATQTGATNLWDALSNLVLAIDGVTVPGSVSTARDTFVNTAGVPKMENIHDLLFGVTGLPAARAVYADRSTSVASVHARITAAQTDVTTAQTALTAATVAKTAAQTEYTNALAVEKAALNSIKAACPLFDANNPSAALA